MLQSLSRVLSKKKKNRMSDVVQQQEPPKSESQKSGKAVPTVMRGGREFHDTKSVYWLPSDDEEMDRLIGVSILDNRRGGKKKGGGDVACTDAAH